MIVRSSLLIDNRTRTDHAEIAISRYLKNGIRSIRICGGNGMRADVQGDCLTGHVNSGCFYVRKKLNNCAILCFFKSSRQRFVLFVADLCDVRSCFLRRLVGRRSLFFRRGRLGRGRRLGRDRRLAAFGGVRPRRRRQREDQQQAQAQGQQLARHGLLFHGLCTSLWLSARVAAQPANLRNQV